jgi:predicted negative regulator of RcsB-dependent stress response
VSDDDLDFMPAPPGGGKPAAKKAPITRATDPVGAAGPGAGAAGPAGAEPAGTEALVRAGGASGDALPGARAELPTWNRSRRKRKANANAEREDDVFQRGVRQASRQVIDTPKLALGTIVILIAVIAGGVALHKRNVSADAEASRVLQAATAAIVRGQVVPPEEQERLGDSIKQYRIPIYSTEEEREAAIVEAVTAAKSAGRSDVERDALLVAAAQAMHAGDFDTAVTEYDAFLDDSKKSHPLRFLALEGKGNALEAKGEYDAALAVFDEIAPNPSDYYRSMALYHRGRVLESLSRTDEALAIYQQFFTEFKTEEVASAMVRARIEELDPEFAAGLAAPPALPFDGSGIGP